MGHREICSAVLSMFDDGRKIEALDLLVEEVRKDKRLCMSNEFVALSGGPVGAYIKADWPGPVDERAREFAKRAHAGQVRKYTGAPYVTHCEAVAALVSRVPHTPAMLAAAYLHDTVEDTGTTVAELREAFGAEVAKMVEELTDVSKPGDGTRAMRKAMDRAHLVNASAAAQTIKLADLIDNTRSIVAHDPKFAKVYLAEKEALLAVLTDGDPALYKMACETYRDAVQNLEAAREQS